MEVSARVGRVVQAFLVWLPQVPTATKARVNGPLGSRWQVLGHRDPISLRGTRVVKVLFNTRRV